jgi:hypothetical protein
LFVYERKGLEVVGEVRRDGERSGFEGVGVNRKGRGWVELDSEVWRRKKRKRSRK